MRMNTCILLNGMALGQIFDVAMTTALGKHAY